MSECTSGTQVTRHGGKMKPLSLRFAKKIFAFTMQKKKLSLMAGLVLGRTQIVFQTAKNNRTFRTSLTS